MLGLHDYVRSLFSRTVRATRRASLQSNINRLYCFVDCVACPMLAKRVHQTQKLRVRICTFPAIDEPAHHLEIATLIVTAAVDAVERCFHLIIKNRCIVRMDREVIPPFLEHAKSRG